MIEEGESEAFSPEAGLEGLPLQSSGSPNSQVRFRPYPRIAALDHLGEGPEHLFIL